MLGTQSCIEEYTSKLEGLRPVEELRGWLSKVDERLSKVEDSVRALKAEVDRVASRVDPLDESLFELIEKMEWVERSVSRRLRDDWIGYRYVDEEGYCTGWWWYGKVEGWDMREGFKEGKIVYYLNVKKHPLICTACPSYKCRG